MIKFEKLAGVKKARNGLWRFVRTANQNSVTLSMGAINELSNELNQQYKQRAEAAILQMAARINSNNAVDSDISNLKDAL